MSSRPASVIKKGRMGVTHPSRILQSGKERGCILVSFGERLDALREAEA
jgi:hypothetical protein